MATYPINFTTSDVNVVSLIQKANATVDPNTGQVFTSTDRAVAYLMANGPQKDALSTYPPVSVDLQRRAAIAAQTNYSSSLISRPSVALGFTFSQALYDFGSIAAGGTGGAGISVDTVGTFPFPGYPGGAVTFTYSAPAGITLSFSPASGTLDSSTSHPIASTVTVSVGAGVQDGVYHIGVFCLGTPNSCKTIVKVTTTGGTVTTDSINGPFQVTRHAAMTIGLPYDFTYTYTLPPGFIALNRWSIWMTRSDMTGQGVELPPPASCAFDVWLWNTQQINLYETNGIATTLLQTGTSGVFTNVIWTVPMSSATLGALGTTIQLYIPSIEFLAAGTYEMFMAANVTASSRGSYFEQDEAESVWYSMGSYVVT